MRKIYISLVFFAIIGVQVSLATDRNVPGSYATIQAAINASATGDKVIVAAGTYSGQNISVNKEVTLQGAGEATTTISHTTGNGIAVSANNVTLKNFTVTGGGGHGIYAGNVTNLTIQNVTANANGTGGSTGSGIALQVVTGTSVLTSVTATNNTNHGLEIGNGSTNVQVVGGTFTGNGTLGNINTGSGILIYADANKSTNGTIIIGALNSSNNKSAGINLSCTPGSPRGHIDGTRIGMTALLVNDGTTTLNDNGSSGSGFSGGAAVVVYGPCDDTRIRANSTRSGSDTWETAGLVVIGTDDVGANSPTNTVAKDCNLSGFTATSPAGTMTVTHGGTTLIGTADVDATVGNSINGAATGFAVEDLLMHKVDNITLGLFRGPGTVLYVSANSGSIQRGITIANNPYSVTQINVQDGTYAENVVVNKALIIAGQGSSTWINPATGTGVEVTVSGVTIQDLKITTTTVGKGIKDNANSVTATNNTFTFKALAKVFLEGPYDVSNPGTMITDLAANEFIPTAQPFNDVPLGYNVAFGYSGSETVTNTSVFIDNNIVDWLLVELRETDNTGAPTIARKAALLNKDGQLVQTDGVTYGVPLSVAKLSGYALDYYVVVRHRNHLAIMTPSAIALPNAANWDFTSNSANSYGEDMVSLGVGKFGMRAGDGVPDGQVVADDRTNAWRVDFAGDAGYVRGDYNCNGFTEANDRTAYWRKNVSLGAVSQVP